MATRAPDRPAAPAGVPTRRHPRRPGWSARLHRIDVAVSPYAYIAPFFLLFSAFGLFPLLYTAWVSLHEWTLLSDTQTFIGAENYATLLTDPYFWNATFNTLSIGIISTVPQLVLAIWLAHLLNRPLRAQTFFRITLLLPNVTSVVAVVVIFSQLFGRDFGLINWVLGLFGAGAIDWAAGTATSHVAISVMIMWRWTGYNALIYLAAMQAVPRELYEAATIDGASGLTQLRRITVPMIRPTIVFTVIVSTIGAMQILAEPLLFAATTSGSGGMVTGGPDRQFQTLALYVYEHGFTNFDFGYASAASWVMFVFVVIAAGVNYLFTRRMGGEIR
ncbi:cellobiose transport system permease protein [Thermocatellispora tengchongensis]|uniref:Cellobiose transport system permease protein n=1 Tax=Thermocatellispora tengchongensis TaxID=1073253 RepID=A0A840P7E9_9ACTN|nr:sugar ABC transporter permease [Thermocatellispora tengchongensis]MBB5134929.1 cellobiose transport system permease protein [Thermocatellispora tengchongensis]